MRLRTACLVALAFGGGLGVGVTLPGSLRASEPQIVRVSGKDPAPVRAIAAAVPAQLPDVRPERAAPAPRRVANDALRYTAFVRGPGVYGAGVLIDASGHVVTCRHVVQGLREIEVSFADTEPLPATLIDQDETLDLALLRIDSQRAPHVRPASIVDVRAGDEVFAMGAPKKLSFSLSRGIVSYVGRNFDGVLYLQSDLPINSGSSGGPVINQRGELIGIMSFVLRETQGLAFALPVDYVLRRFARTLGAPLDFTRFEAWLAEPRPNVGIH